MFCGSFRYVIYFQTSPPLISDDCVLDEWLLNTHAQYETLINQFLCYDYKDVPAGSQFFELVPWDAWLVRSHWGILATERDHLQPGIWEAADC